MVDALSSAAGHGERTRGPVVPGRRRRERIAAVAKGRESRSRGGDMQSASDTPSSHSRRVGAQPKRGLWPLLVAQRRAGAGRTGAQSVVALRESRRRGIDPPGITSADATLLAYCPSI